MNKTNLSKCTAVLNELYPLCRQIVYESFDKQEKKITRTQQIILITMVTTDVMSMSELARSICTSNEQATRAVAQLVDMNFIKREQNRSNRRIINISLTDEAKDYLKLVDKVLKAELMAKLEIVSDEEAKQLIESLSMVAKLLKAE
jgi:DNA-binding MarR family transcriptional regulator